MSVVSVNDARVMAVIANHVVAVATFQDGVGEWALEDRTIGFKMASIAVLNDTEPRHVAVSSLPAENPKRLRKAIPGTEKEKRKGPVMDLFFVLVLLL